MLFFCDINKASRKLMKKYFLMISMLSTLFFLTGCTYAEIETKANETGNVLGRLLRGASNGFVEGFSGNESKP
tara:strand:- start:479 stop:697 length:219 start_codon:yes stop_codon:yes gene_type:complete